MKKSLILILALLVVSQVFAQRAGKDLVYLKSGGIIKGQIITHDLDLVKINSAGNQWVFKNSEVDSVSKYQKIKPVLEINRRYFFDTSLGVLVGNSGNSQKAPFSFMTSANYRVYHRLYAGLGFGAEFLDETYMPAFAQIQYKFRESKVAPFVNLQAGFQIPLESESRKNFNNYYVDYSSSYWPGYQYNTKLETEGGFFINPSVGFQQSTSDNFGWFFSFGYRFHQLNYSGENNYELETNFSRLSLKIGFIFN